ncbi:MULTISPECIES: DinB family protein [Flavobacterium]|uniref:DinB family protein n=1 Tax=Flavobacterium TaxID=237 RepID=UPI001184524B|nr:MULTISPECIES: DinB family protein [Flavobacterium]MCR4033201.1 DinB family protein [Flavobacterium panacis]
MSLKKIMSNYADYNLWVNQQFVNWLSPKSDDLLYAEVPSSFSTIMKTLDHIWSTEEYWFSVISETTMSQKKTENELSKDEIWDGLLNSSTKLHHLIHSLSEEDLMKEVKITNPWFECQLPIVAYLIQVINHGTYHRGQIVTMGRNVGITDASNTDYNFYNVIKQK